MLGELEPEHHLETRELAGDAGGKDLIRPVHLDVIVRGPVSPIWFVQR